MIAFLQFETLLLKDPHKPISTSDGLYQFCYNSIYWRLDPNLILKLVKRLTINSGSNIPDDNMFLFLFRIMGVYSDCPDYGGMFGLSELWRCDCILFAVN